MRLLERFRRRWVELRNEGVRELDERQRLLRLLAWRDSLVVLMISLILLAAVQLYFVRRYEAIPISFAFAPMYALTLAALFFFISFRRRGGGFSSNVAAFQATVFAVAMVIGTLIGWLIMRGLTSAGDVSAPRTGFSLGGHLVGLGIGMGVVFLLVRRMKPPED